MQIITCLAVQTWCACPNLQIQSSRAANPGCSELHALQQQLVRMAAHQQCQMRAPSSQPVASRPSCSRRSPHAKAVTAAAAPSRISSGCTLAGDESAHDSAAHARTCPPCSATAKQLEAAAIAETALLLSALGAGASSGCRLGRDSRGVGWMGALGSLEAGWNRAEGSQDQHRAVPALQRVSKWWLLWRPALCMYLSINNMPCKAVLHLCRRSIPGISRGHAERMQLN